MALLPWPQVLMETITIPVPVVGPDPEWRMCPSDSAAFKCVGRCTENRATVKSLSHSDSIFCPPAYNTFRPKPERGWASVTRRSGGCLGRGMSWLAAAARRNRHRWFVISRQVPGQGVWQKHIINALTSHWIITDIEVCTPVTQW